MMSFFKHHILHLHQADLGASLVLIQLHRDILDILLRLRNDYMLQGVYTFSVSDSFSISGRMSARDLTAPSKSPEVNANP